MRNFPCLSRGDTIWLKYHGEPVSFTVLKVYSDQGSCESISCIDTDLKVVFERPLDCPPTPLENQPARASSLLPALHFFSFLFVFCSVLVC